MKRFPIYAATLILCGLPTLADAGPRPFKQGGFDNPAAQMGRKALKGGALAGAAALRKADSVSIDASLDRNHEDGRSGSLDTALSTELVTYEASTAYDSDTGFTRSVDVSGTEYSVSREIQTGLDENGNRAGYHTISAAGADGALETQTERDAETGFSRVVDASGVNGSFSRDAQATRDDDGRVDASRSTAGSGDRGTFESGAALNADTGYTRSAQANGADRSYSREDQVARNEEGRIEGTRTVSASGDKRALDVAADLDAETGYARSVDANGADRSYTEDAQIARNEEGRIEGTRTVNASGDQGTFDVAAELDAETGFSNSVDIASAQGAFSSQANIAWTEENGPSASRSVSAFGEQGAFDAETTLNTETGLVRSFTASGDQGSVDVKTEVRVGEGVSRDVVCTNPAGEQVACP